MSSVDTLQQSATVNRIARFVAPPAKPATPPTFAERLDSLFDEDGPEKTRELFSYVRVVLGSQVNHDEVPARLKGAIRDDLRRGAARRKRLTKFNERKAGEGRGSYLANRLLAMHQSKLVGGVFAEAGGVHRVTYFRTIYRPDNAGRVVKFRVQHIHHLRDAELHQEVPRGLKLPPVAKALYKQFPAWLAPERRILVGHMFRNQIIAHEEQTFEQPIRREWDQDDVDADDPAILLGPYVIHGWF